MSMHEEMNIQGNIALEGDVLPQPDESAEYYQPKQGLGIDLSILKKPTGEGPIEDYVFHPLNYNESKGMAKIIRGFTGIIGELNFAIVDIISGIFDLTSKKKVIEDGNFERYGDNGVS